MPIAIDWADLDLFGHVNNVVFFRYIQAARVNYCELIGLTSLNNNDRLSFMVASSQCQFKKPLHFPGTVTVKARVEWIKTTSFQLEYRLEKNGELYAEGTDVIVVFDHHHKLKAAMPAQIREAVSRTEQRDF